MTLNPGSIGALGSISTLLVILERNDESLVYAKEALERDPLNLQALSAVSMAYTYLDECEEAEEIAKRALSLSSEASRFNGHVGICWALGHDDFARSIEWYEKEPLAFMGLTGLAIAHNKLGEQDKAQHYLDELIAANGESASYQYGQIYAQWGQTEKALDALEHALEIGDTGFVLLNGDKNLSSLHQEPRFIALMEIWRGSSEP